MTAKQRRCLGLFLPLLLLQIGCLAWKVVLVGGGKYDLLALQVVDGRFGSFHLSSMCLEFLWSMYPLLTNYAWRQDNGILLRSSTSVNSSVSRLKHRYIRWFHYQANILLVLTLIKEMLWIHFGRKVELVKFLDLSLFCFWIYFPFISTLFWAADNWKEEQKKDRIFLLTKRQTVCVAAFVFPWLCVLCISVVKFVAEYSLLLSSPQILMLMLWEDFFFVWFPVAGFMRWFLENWWKEHEAFRLSQQKESQA